MAKIQTLVIYIFAAICVTSCTTKKRNSQWDTAEINAAISKDSIYKELDKQPELFSVVERQDLFMKRTSDVAYFSGHKLNVQDASMQNIIIAEPIFFIQTLYQLIFALETVLEGMVS